MIEKLFNSFLENEKTGMGIDTIIIVFLLISFVVCTAFVWYWMVKLRGIALKGMEGENGMWESHEQIIYWATFMVPPIVFKAAFVSDVPLYVWYFLAGIILFALFGRGVLDYILAFFGRAPVKKEEPEPSKVTTTTTTEVK